MSDEVLIDVENVSKKFCRSLKRSLWYGVKDIGRELAGRNCHNENLREGEFWAVKDVSFQVRRGECLGLIGRNGAGKTTLLRMLNGLIRPDQGKITMRGQVGALIALGAGFNPILTGRENVYAAGAVLGLSTKEIDEKYYDIVEFAELEEFMEAPVQSYSSGMQVRLGFAVAMQMDPDILILDEVLAVGDVSFRAKCYNALGQLRKKGVAFVLVSHNTQDILRHCSNIIFLKKGMVEGSGLPVDVMKLYLEETTKNPSAIDNFCSDEKINGSGKIVIEEVYLNSRKPPVNLRPESALELLIKYVNTTNQDVFFVFDMTMYDNDGVMFKTSISKEDSGNVLISKSKKHGVLRIFFECVNCNNQSISISFSFWDHLREEIFDWKRNVLATVLWNPDQMGKFCLKFQVENKFIKNIN